MMFDTLPQPEVIELHGLHGMHAFNLARATFSNAVAQALAVAPVEDTDDFWGGNPFEGRRLSPELEHRIRHLTLCA